MVAGWNAHRVQRAAGPDLISSFSNDIYVVTVADKAVKKIVSTPGPDTNPKWSPDGKRIAYQTARARSISIHEWANRGGAGEGGRRKW